MEGSGSYFNGQMQHVIQISHIHLGYSSVDLYAQTAITGSLYAAQGRLEGPWYPAELVLHGCIGIIQTDAGG
jgi:hypothetical protein